jgi:RND family efflux transporter MFP subunit
MISVLVLAGLASGGYWYYTSRIASADSATGDGAYTQVVEVTQGNLSNSLSVVGSLEAVQGADLAFTEMSGTAKLLSLEVQIGQTVASGQVLATIDSAPYQQALDEARSHLLAAEEALADLQTPPTALTIAQAEVAVAAAEQTLEQARANLADLTAPALTSLEEAVRDAQDTLDLLDLESELAERDSLAQSERDLTYTVAWYQLHIAQLEELVAQNKANLEQRETITAEQEQLAKARADLARVQAERELARQARAAQRAEAQAALAEAQEALSEARAGGDKLELAQAELAVRQAEVALEAAQEDRAELEEGTDPTDVAAAQAEVDARRLAVSDAETALAGTQLVAPFDGTVLEIYASAGDPVGASTSIVTLANLESFQVVASVDETTIRQVSAGQEAVISFDAYPDQSFTGEVLSVPLYGTLQGDVTVYDVPLSLEGAEALNLLVGMTANVELQVGQATDALLVPTMALTRANGGYQVLVPNTADPSGEPETVPVQVGLSDGTYTQILKGLNAGDQVLVQLDLTESEGNFQRSSSGVFSNIFRFGGGR